MIYIYVGTTGVKLECSELDYSTFALVKSFGFRRLTTFEYNPRTKSSKPVHTFYLHNDMERTFFIPINFYEMMLSHLDSSNLPYEIHRKPAYGLTPLTIEMDSGFTDREGQTEAINFLTSGKGSRLGLDIQTGCLVGDTKVKIRALDGELYTTTLMHAHLAFGLSNALPEYQELYCKSLIGNSLGMGAIDDIVYSGMQEVYVLLLENGKYLEGTADHLIKTTDGWVPIIACEHEEVICDPADTPYNAYTTSKVVGVRYIGIKPTYDICCCGAPNFVANGIVVHNSGKSYISTKSMIKYGHATLIVVSGLVDQWIESLKDQTTITDDKLYRIQGAPSIIKLLASDKRPEVFVCSIATLRNFAFRTDTFTDCISLQEFIEQYGIGTKIVDEAHLYLHANTSVDMLTNIPNNIYVTATFATSNRQLERILYTLFPDDMLYGMGKYSKFVDYTFYSYSGIVNSPCVRYRKYSHFMYENALAKQDSVFMNWYTNVLLRLIEAHYIYNRKGKLAIYMSLRTSIQRVQVLLEQQYPDLIVKTYIGGDPDSNRIEADIIVTTFESCGTGDDVPDLSCLINTVSFNSKTRCVQLPGRLRFIKDRKLQYIDIVNKSIPSQVRHYQTRSSIYRSLCKTYAEVDLGYS